MKYKEILLILALGLMGSGCSNIENSRNLGNPNVSAKTLAAQVCSNCHGLDGNSISPAFPKLAGQQAGYIVSQLSNFRSHQRLDPPGPEYMWGLSRHLTTEQIDGLAEYYSKQVPQRVSAANVDPKLLAEGKEIFEKGVPAENVIACMACHGPQAQGMATFPRLAFQHSNYILKQLEIFQNTQGRPGTPMDAVVHPLTSENKNAIAAYLQAFPD